MAVYVSTEIDPRFILASDLQGLFRDKITGLPLRSGYIETYSENDRITPKSLWVLSGGPGGPYTYTELENPLPLTGIGTYSDGMSNDIIPYWFPYEGLPEDFSTETELYFVQVYSQGDIFQFSRIAWPNFSAAGNGSSNAELINYVPNGQFLAHNNLPAINIDPTYQEGEIRAPITYVAQGGWVFRRPNSSTATDIVLFGQYSWTDNPTGNPRFYINISNQGGGVGDQYKDLALDFTDVNKFSSPGASPLNYTLSFTGYTLSGNIPISLYLIKNFGTGGTPSAQTSLLLTTFTLTTTRAIKQYTFTFGDNSGKSIGTNNDDYVELAIRFPIGSAFSNAIMTDFSLNIGTEIITSFQDETDADMLTRGVAGWMPIPDPDGFDLYLPLRLTRRGMEFDHTEIGKIYSVIYAEAGIGQLLCDGSKYPFAGYSDDGIPYARLGNILLSLSQTGECPLFGTGLDFSTAYLINQITPPDINVRLTNNSPGVVANTANGAVATPFTFNTTHTGFDFSSVGYGLICNMIADTIIQVEQFSTGSDPTPPADGSGGSATNFVFTVIRNNTNIQEVFTIEVPAIPGLSTYFTFHSVSTGLDYYVWFKIDGAGTDPAVAMHTGIEIDLFSYYETLEVARSIQQALNGWQQTVINFQPASMVTAGSYFTFSATGNDYYVWYVKNGVGVDPTIAGRIAIRVEIGLTFTANQVAFETGIAINQTYFAVPDLRGKFIRGWNNGSLNDPDAATRFSILSLYYGDLIGTSELDALLGHSHGLWIEGTDPDESSVGIENVKVADGQTAITGGKENRPNNISLNYVIKY